MKGVFCFFVNLEILGVGEEERLRFVAVVVVVTVVVASWSAEVEESEEEVERLVFAAEGFCTELAWRVTLESLETWTGLVVTTLVVLVTVGLGGLEKSNSDSLSDELEGEDDAEEEASTFVDTGVLGTSSSDLLSDEELSEDDFDSALTAAAVVAAASLGGSAADSLPDEEVSEEEDELADGLETGASVRSCETNLVPGLEASFFTDTALTPAEDEVSESDSDSELEGLVAFRLKPFTNPLTVGFCEVAGVYSCAPAFSFSSSASLSELELDVDGDDGFIFDNLLVFWLDFCAKGAFFISASESLSSSLLSLPLLLVMFFAMTLAAAASLALASAFTSFFAFFAFFETLTALASSLSSLSLLLVSSTCDLSW